MDVEEYSCVVAENHGERYVLLKFQNAEWIMQRYRKALETPLS
jgi:hypothetical protein